jgi:hypothetical protein
LSFSNNAYLLRAVDEQQVSEDGAGSLTTGKLNAARDGRFRNRDWNIPAGMVLYPITDCGQAQASVG